ncbi:hypothetical protein PAHAL_4G051300 [Panicum hallii]|uniref:Uncharacterized protein n=1 Tax=Panicum hallii TaxID=206008 RepID=A0A2T8JBU3_9POAL|nr:hypothetical protein PAHAL_4G051300 [Panicum hallii]
MHMAAVVDWSHKTLITFVSLGGSVLIPFPIRSSPGLVMGIGYGVQLLYISVESAFHYELMRPYSTSRPFGLHA